MADDLETVIDEAVTEAVTPEPDTGTEVEASPPPEAEAAADTPSEENAPATTEVDEFAKQYGIPPTTVAGRENRLPYSRVRKIVENAVTRKAQEYEPKIQEYEAKIQSYESTLAELDGLERMLTEEPMAFLQALAELPQYQPFFQAIDRTLAQQPPAATEARPSAQDDDPMPQPNRKLADGTLVYDLDGIQQLLDWKARQIERKVSDRLAPIEQTWQAQEVLRTVLPKIQAQIAQARTTWPQFTEHEAEIVAALEADPHLSLEGAYQQVVVPRLLADRERMRQEVLQELRQAPKATTVSTRPQKAAKPTAPPGTRDLEDVIREAIADAGLTESGSRA